MKKQSIVFVILISVGVFLVSCKQKNTNQQNSERQELKNGHETLVINTADDAITELKKGNKRFLEGKLINTDYKSQIENTKSDQHPHSVILSCLDSRVPPEIIFDQGIGNIFVARVAGNVEDANILGSMEFATKVKGSKLIVVMGHSSCGAIKGAIDNAELGNLTQLVDQIKPAIPKEKMSKEDLLDAAAKNNITQTMRDILDKSPVIKELIAQNQINIVGAYYDITTGKVDFFPETLLNLPQPKAKIKIEEKH